MTYRYPDPLDVITSTLLESLDPDPAVWRSREEADLGPVLDALPGGGRVLDVGAGRGRLADRLADRFERVIALEPDPSRAEDCRRAVAGRANVTVVCADLAGAPLGEGEVDAVVCHHVLQHVPTGAVPTMLAGMRRVLRPGGTLVLVTTLTDGPDAFVALGRRGKAVTQRRISAGEFDMLAAGAGHLLPVHLFSEETLVRLLSAFPGVHVSPLPGSEDVLRSAVIVSR